MHHAFLAKWRFAVKRKENNDSQGYAGNHYELETGIATGAPTIAAGDEAGRFHESGKADRPGRAPEQVNHGRGRRNAGADLISLKKPGSRERGLNSAPCLTMAAGG